MHVRIMRLLFKQVIIIRLFTKNILVIHVLVIHVLVIHVLIMHIRVVYVLVMNILIMDILIMHILMTQFLIKIFFMNHVLITHIINMHLPCPCAWCALLAALIAHSPLLRERQAFTSDRSRGCTAGPAHPVHQAQSSYGILSTRHNLHIAHLPIQSAYTAHSRVKHELHLR